MISRCIVYLFFILLMYSCKKTSNGNKQASDLHPDSIKVVRRDSSQLIEIVNKDSLDRAIIESGIEKLFSLRMNLKTYQTIELKSFSNERELSAMYYFDSLYTLIYSTATWEAESSHGSYSHYFKNDQLIASYEEKIYTGDSDTEEISKLLIGYKPCGFLKSKETGTSEKITFLVDEECDYKKSEAEDEINRVLNTIRENQDSIIMKEDHAVLHVQTEEGLSEDYVIMKILVDKLLTK